MTFLQPYFPLFVPFITVLLAEVVKFLIDSIRQRKKTRFISPGGMPSGHSAFVGGLLMTVGHQEGFESTLFLVTAVFSVLVMYDAIHLRYEAGKHAKAINQYHPDSKLEESLGHTHLEVAVGVVFGAGVAWLLLFI